MSGCLQENYGYEQKNTKSNVRVDIAQVLSQSTMTLPLFLSVNPSMVVFIFHLL